MHTLKNQCLNFIKNMFFDFLGGKPTANTSLQRLENCKVEQFIFCRVCDLQKAADYIANRLDIDPYYEYRLSDDDEVREYPKNDKRKKSTHNH